jgi:iron(III) transport system permease protein
MSEVFALPEVAPVRSRRQRNGGPLPLSLVIPSLLTALLVALPLAYILIRALGGGLDHFLGILLTSGTAALIYKTMALIAGVVILSLAIAIPYAWLVVRTDLPMRRLWATLGALPLVFPSYVAAFSLVGVFGPRGFAQGWLARFGVERLPELAYGYTGALLTLGLFTYPYLFLLLIASLRSSDPALEETSRSLGTGRWATFFRVVLPQLRPALYGGTLLVILYTLSDFGAVSIVRYDTFTLSIYNAYRGLFDRTVAASLAVVLMAITFGFLLLEGRLVSRVRSNEQRSFSRPRQVALGRWRTPALFFTGTLALVTLVLPIATMLYWFAQAPVTGPGPVLSPIVNSVGASGVAAIAAVLMAIPISVLAVRHPGRLSRLIERLAYGGYALPGLVIALALVFFVTRFAFPLYQTFTLLAIAYVIRFLPEALAAARGAVHAIPRSLEEAARGLGLSRSRVLLRVTVPLMRGGLFAGGGLVFLTAMKELPATLILRPTGFDTLATRIWSSAADGFYAEAAIPSMVLLGVSALPVYLLVIRPVLDGSRR